MLSASNTELLSKNSLEVTAGSWSVACQHGVAKIVMRRKQNVIGRWDQLRVINTFWDRKCFDDESNNHPK